MTKASNLRNRRRRRGIITLLGSMMLLFIVIPVVGLAIDAGVLFMVKSKLQAAVDGASLASARSLSEALSLSSQQTSATDAATRWFHGNMPNNWMGIGTVSDPTVTFPSAPPRTIVVNISGSVTAPTWFMRILGFNGVTVNAVGEASRRFVNIMLVIDRSGSLYQSGSCGAVQNAAATFVNSFVNGQDRLGLVTFGTDYRVDFPPAYNFASAGPPNMVTMVNSLYCYGYTNAAAAYWLAYQELVTLNDAGALNVILFFTDGQPNTLTFGIAPDGTNNSLQAKTLATPSTYANYGYDNKNPTTCKDINGKVSGQAGWSPGPFVGVMSFAAGIYVKDTASFPASQAVDAVKIGALQGDKNGGCAFDAQFGNAGTIYSGGNPSRAIAGPGFPAMFDIAYIPDEDIFRNLTGNGFSGAAYAPVSRYPNTFPAAYQNKIRVDNLATCTGGCSLGFNDVTTNAGINALDNAAQRARADSVTRGLNVYTYTIGLGNAPGGVDDELLRRIANDPGAGNFKSAQPVGQYTASPTAAQLNQAFSEIASSVLRLSK